MNSVKKVSTDDCYGCSACFSVCKNKAISMQMSDKGFFAPQISDTCIDCGMCVKCCPALQSLEKNTIMKCWAIKNMDDTVRENSSSGGAFSAIATDILNRNGVIYGAAFREKRIVHLRTEGNDYSILRKSKYVQSELGTTFSNVIHDLQSDKTVMFTGTPCQCAGLRALLSNKNIDTCKLLLVDFICHGTLSPMIFSDYIKYFEKKTDKIVVNFDFRDKSKGWHRYIGRSDLSDGTYDNTSFESQLFISLFYSNYSFKESCYHCRFTTPDRCSDITLADFWGIEKRLPDIDDDKGISFIMACTEKGIDVIHSLSNVQRIEVPFEWESQAHLHHPISRPADNDMFWKIYYQNGFKKIAAVYLKAGKIRRFASKLLRKIK